MTTPLDNDVLPAHERCLAGLARRYVAFSRHRTVLLTVALLVLALSTVIPIQRLQLRTDMAALLPDQHPAVAALRRIEGRMRSMMHLSLLIHGPDQASSLRCQQALQTRLEQLIPKQFSEVQIGPRKDIPDFLRRYRAFYLPLKDLQRIDELTEQAIANRINPLVISLDDQDPEQELRKLASELEHQPGAEPVANQRNPPYFEAATKDGHYLAMILWRPLTGIGTSSDRESVASVRKLVDDAKDGLCDRGVAIDPGGQLVIALEEQDSIRSDLTLASLFCMVLVLVAIYLQFRRFLLVVLLGVPAVLAVQLSMAFASLTVGELNVNSAFLLSVILGNGINPGIIVLSRYGEERLKGASAVDAMTQALVFTLQGTGAAMAAASIAYGSLTLTSFRGFSQFGLLGVTGMFLSWMGTLLFLPPLVMLGERWAPMHMSARPSLYLRPFVHFAQLTNRWPRLLVALSMLGVIGSVGSIWRFAADPLEWNFSKLRGPVTPGGAVGARMASVGLGDIAMGYVGSYGVLGVDGEAQAEPVAEALRQRCAAQGNACLLAKVRTLQSFLPEQQEEKLVVLRHLRAQLVRHGDRLNEEDRRTLDRLLAPQTLKLLTVDDLPESARLAFTELDGQRGRLIGIDHRLGYSDWDGHEMLRMADQLSFDAQGRRWVVASAATIFGGMLSAILADGPRVTLVALSGVVLLIVLLFGVRNAVPILLALAIGLTWLAGIVSALQLKLNYINFVTLPIAIGMGSDYAANIWSRWRSEQAGSERMARVISGTGPAVALCSLTTIIGYCSLLFAGNRAIRSFAMMSALGEACCLLAALVALPALATALLRYRKN
jgi:predicted exporter